MMKLILKTLKIAVVLICAVMPLNVYSEDGIEDVLLVSSYAPGTRRVESITSSIEVSAKRKSKEVHLILEAMTCGAYDDSPTWKNQMKLILNRYKNSNLDAIVLIGQEAWATYLSLDTVPNVKIYGCFVSREGVLIANSKQDAVYTNPQSVDMVQLAESRGFLGGIIYDYDVLKNVDLITMLYPGTRNVALLTDNSYGGVSIASYFKQEMKKYPSINAIILDGQHKTFQQLKTQLGELPPNTAILLHSWRIDYSGVFFLQSSLSELLSDVKHIPVFSMSQAGVGSVALGGYSPDYANAEDFFLEKIKNYGFKSAGNTYKMVQSHYRFSRRMLDECGIPLFRLPKESVIVTEDDMKVQQYKSYIIIGIGILLVLGFAFVLASVMYVKNKKTNAKLLIQQKELNEKHKELVKAKEDAVRADKLKSAFLANMSHEIRTPLNAIVGFTDLICAGGNSEEEQVEYMKIIKDNTTQLLNLINDVLDISKIESGTIEFRYMQFDLVQCMSNIYASLKKFVVRQEVEFRLEIPDESCLVLLDEQKVRQMITNFVTNAIKFTTEGSIVIGYLHRDDGVEIYCEDTGIGIEADKADKVFKRFYQSNDFAKGTGLGLAICKALVEGQGGKIGVESEYGKGSRFWGWYPIDNNEKPEEDK